jgi:processive 1,2-diacylglycerol beta-glucosyltransferase
MTRKLFRQGQAPNVVVYSPYPETHACAYIRIIAPMRAAAWNVIWAPKQGRSWQLLDVEIARTADLIVVQRQFPSVATEDVLKALLRLRIPIVYDLDDMLLDVPRSHPSHVELHKRTPYIKWALREVDLVTVSTSQLEQSLKGYTSRPVRVQPNLVDWALFDKPPRRRNGTVCFLISGTSTHRSDWALIEEPLAAILAKYGNVAKAVFFGQAPSRFAAHPSVKVIEFEDRYAQYASRLRTLDIDAALVPLEDNEFNRCKSDIKWLEYSAAGIPGAYSDVMPYRSSIRHRTSGLLVANIADAWFEAMDVLVSDPQATSFMIDNSRQQVHEKYTVESATASYIAMYEDLLGHKHRREIFSGLSTLGPRLMTRAQRAVTGSPFLGRHVMWRINKK